VTDDPDKNDEAAQARMEEEGKLAKTLADHIGPGIANLKLRESMRNLSTGIRYFRSGIPIEPRPGTGLCSVAHRLLPEKLRSSTVASVSSGSAGSQSSITGLTGAVAPPDRCALFPKTGHV
jgi:hypothetical protein